MLSRIERTLIFSPKRYPVGNWNPVGFSVEDVWLRTSDGIRLHAWFCPCLPPGAEDESPSTERPVLLYCHGNAGNLSDRIPNIVRWQQALGVDVFIFDYRGYGRSEGFPGEKEMYRDSRAAYRWLVEERGIEPDRLILFGKSLGGAIALELGLEVPHVALVLEATFTSLPDVAKRLYPWLPVHSFLRTRFPSAERIGSYRRPVVISHGVLDQLIPVDQARELYRRANEPKQLIEIPHANHNDCTLVGGREYFDRVRALLEETMTRRVWRPSVRQAEDTSE